MSFVGVHNFMNGPSVLPLGSDDGIESIVEPLHWYFHHLSQGVVLCAFVVLVANGLISKKQERNSLNTRKKKGTSHRLLVQVVTLVSRLMWIVFPSTPTETFLSSVKSTHSSPNISLRADSEALQTHWLTRFRRAGDLEYVLQHDSQPGLENRDVHDGILCLHDYLKSGP